jgi:hypothetical protein
MLTDAQWTMLEPLVEACRPHAKVPPSDLRRFVKVRRGEARGYDVRWETSLVSDS